MIRKEADVKRHIREMLEERGIWYTMPHQAGFSRPGVPDFLCCYRGAFLAIEAKFNGNKPTQAQLQQMDLIRQSGGDAIVIDEKSLEFLEAWLEHTSSAK